MKTLNTEIEALIETMHEQFIHIRQYENTIPQIELDILMSNLRKTYECVVKLSKLNLKEEVPPAVELVAPTPMAEVVIEPTPVAETPVIDAASAPLPVIEEIPVPTVEMVKEEAPLNSVEEKKEPLLKIKTTLPFDIPQLNFLKKEEAPKLESEVKEGPIVKKENTLRLKSTTLPGDLPPGTSYNPYKPAQTAPAATVKEPMKSIFDEIMPVAPTPEIKNEPVKKELPLFQPEPVAIASEPVTNNDETTVELEINMPTLTFEPEVSQREHMNLNTSREKIFKEESLIQKMNPLSKIVSLFDDTPVQDRPKESLSILDKLMKKREDTSLAEMLKHSPIGDLKTAIGINQKFQFINELFNGNYEDYNASIDLINKCRSFTDAEIFIAENLFEKYKWEAENKNVGDFMDLVERRFL